MLKAWARLSVTCHYKDTNSRTKRAMKYLSCVSWRVYRITWLFNCQAFFQLIFKPFYWLALSWVYRIKFLIDSQYFFKTFLQVVFWCFLLPYQLANTSIFYFLTYYNTFLKENVCELQTGAGNVDMTMFLGCKNF